MVADWKRAVTVSKALRSKVQILPTHIFDMNYHESKEELV